MLYDVIANYQIKIIIRKLFINLFISSCKNLEQFIGCNPGSSLKRFNTPVFTLLVEMGREIASPHPISRTLEYVPGMNFTTSGLMPS
jgi:hypothetical protein